MFQKLRTFCAREEIRGRLVLATLSAIVLIYITIELLSHKLTGHPSAGPLFLRLHPERLLAMAAAVLGLLRLIDHLQTGKDLLKPLCWILFASLVHLGSIAIQLGGLL